MRLIAIVIAGVLGATTAATAVLAGSVKLQGTYSASQIDLACINAQGTVTTGTGAGGFGCKTDKGEVSCTREGECTGTCQRCGTRLVGGNRQLLGAVLTNSRLSAGEPSGGGQAPGAVQQMQRPVGGTGTGWSAECKSCLDKCDSDYPNGGGPLQTCKNLCKTAGTCPAKLGIEAGGGRVAPPLTRY